MTQIKLGLIILLKITDITAIMACSINKVYTWR